MMTSLQLINNEISRLETKIAQYRKELELYDFNAEDNLENLYEGIEIDFDLESYEDHLEILYTIKKDLEALEAIKDKIEFEDLGEMLSGNVYRGYFNDCYASVCSCRSISSFGSRYRSTFAFDK